MRLWLVLILVPFLCVPQPGKAQLKEIRAIQQQLPAIKDSASYVDALNRLGMLFHLKSIDSCFYYVQKAKPVADRLKYAKGQAGALNNLAIVHLLKQNVYLASKYFNSSLDIYRKINDSSNECQLMMNLGVTLQTDNKLEESRKYLTDAYNLGSTLKNDSILSLVILNIIVDTANVHADSVKILLDKAEVISKKHNDYRCLAVIAHARGDQLIQNGKMQEGLQAIQGALQLAKGLGIEYERIGADIDLGDIYLAANDTANAINYYKDGLTTATLNGYQSFQIVIAQKLYDYYAGKNNMQLSNLYAGMLIKTYRDFQQVIQQSGIDYVDYSIKTAELESLKNNSRANVLAIIILSVLSSVIIVLLFFTLRAQKAKNKLVELLKQRNDQAGNRNAELQFKNEFNNRLISLLAHDFRQPLAAVKGMMSLLKEPGGLSAEEMNLLVGKIETSSDTSLEIFDNILLWIKKQVSGFVYEPLNMQLKELVDSSAKALNYLTDKFCITVVNNVVPGTEIFADKEMLQFVNRNLIHNAIKFSPEGASIVVAAEKNGDEIIVSIKDAGKGMTKEKLDSLFNIFSKTQYSSDKEKGSGVALVICKDFLERMNGRIWAESQPGEGSTFFYAVPVH